MDFDEKASHATPQPLCAVFEPLLPLLQLNELDATKERAVREHVLGCAWCQELLSEYDDVRNALRRHYGAEQGAVAQFVLEDILTSAADDDLATPTFEASRATPFTPRHRLPRRRLTAAAALAAALLLALLAASLFRWQGSPAGGTEVPGLGTLQTFPLPTAHGQPRAIVAGRDGNLWVAENGKIGRITPKGTITEFPLSAGVILNGLAAGPDGNIWFTEGSAGGTGKIGRLTPRDGKVSEFALPTRGITPILIVAGPDGNVWFGAGNYNSTTLPASEQAEIGRITPQGALTLFPLVGTVPPDGLTAGPDGNLWFTTVSGNGDVIGRITPQGSITWFPAASIVYCNCGLSMITAGPDGNLWYVGTAGGSNGVYRGDIGRVTPQGVITEFPLPGNPATDPNAAIPNALANGPDGNLWFLAGDEHTLGRITIQGSITEFAIPHAIALGGITLGPDGNLWLVDTAAGTIDRVKVAHSG